MAAGTEGVVVGGAVASLSAAGLAVSGGPLYNFGQGWPVL